MWIFVLKMGYTNVIYWGECSDNSYFTFFQSRKIVTLPLESRYFFFFKLSKEICYYSDNKAEFFKQLFKNIWTNSFSAVSRQTRIAITVSCGAAKAYWHVLEHASTCQWFQILKKYKIPFICFSLYKQLVWVIKRPSCLSPLPKSLGCSENCYYVIH